MTDQITQRIFEKLDAIQATQSTTAADIARIQGGQRSMEQSVSILSTALGDVNQVRVTAAMTSEKISAIDRELGELRKQFADKEWRLWAERLVSGGLGSALTVGALRILG